MNAIELNLLMSIRFDCVFAVETNIHSPEVAYNGQVCIDGQVMIYLEGKALPVCVDKDTLEDSALLIAQSICQQLGYTDQYVSSETP